MANAKDTVLMNELLKTLYGHQDMSEITESPEIMPIDQDMILGLVMGSVGGASKKGHDVINKIIKKNKESISNLKNLERIGKKAEAKNILDKKFIDDLLERNPVLRRDRTGAFRFPDKVETKKFDELLKKSPELYAEAKPTIAKGLEDLLKFAIGAAGYKYFTNTQKDKVEEASKMAKYLPDTLQAGKTASDTTKLPLDFIKNYMMLNK
jgi:hypothetical protein